MAAAGSLSNRQLQVLFAGVLRAYAERSETSAAFAAFTPADSVTATDVAVGASAMLDAANMAVFELGMWQTIKGRS